MQPDKVTATREVEQGHESLLRVESASLHLFYKCRLWLQFVVLKQLISLRISPFSALNEIES
jgi:hypothetical protein